ncbi:MAG: hypothetical protein L0Y74_11555, partial [candidate division Zixibacteria bacterium]|nr:hypothetical protein [candidate division Zixibacteria bacterium]
MQHIFLKGTVTVLLLLLVTSLALGQVSVPNRLNFQGRLTDGSGNPVADGSHTVNFTLWTLPVAGTNVWTENTSQTTSGGLFTHNLGSITAFAVTLFENYDSLFLQIVADGQTITPRIRLTSSPYARLANNIETWGTDGAPNIQTGGDGYGEIWLRDQDASNFLGVNLGAYGNGGAIDLHNNAGATVISLDAGLTGDASALLLSNAVNALEISNESGTASNLSTGSVTLTGVIQTLLSRTITVPSSGYVLAIGSAEAQEIHTNGTDGLARFGVSDVAGTFPASQSLYVRFDDSQPTGVHHDIFAVHGLFSVAAGATTFYFLAEEAGGNFVCWYPQLSLVFIPTAYGTVTSTLAATSTGSEPNSAASGQATLAENNLASAGFTPTQIAAEQKEAEVFNLNRIA